MIYEIVSILAMVVVLILSTALFIQRRMLISLERTTYQLRKMIDLDIQRNVLSDSNAEFQKRLIYLRSCMHRYRLKEGD